MDPMVGHRGRRSGQKFYAVRVGRRSGVFDTWRECEAQVKEYPGAVHRAFRSREEAERYVGGPAPASVPRAAGAARSNEANRAAMGPPGRPSFGEFWASCAPELQAMRAIDKEWIRSHWR